MVREDEGDTARLFAPHTLTAGSSTLRVLRSAVARIPMDGAAGATEDMDGDDPDDFAFLLESPRPSVDMTGAVKTTQFKPLESNSSSAAAGELYDGFDDFDLNDAEDGVPPPLPEPLFDMKDESQAEKFNEFRLKYRSFRKGKARGAKGEVQQFAMDPKSQAAKSNSAVPPFLNKLYTMLSDPESENYIEWGGDGTSIVVKKVDEFSNIVLPKYFKHKKFASFLRQLNMYNFYTTHQEHNMRQFTNPLFRRDGHNSLRNIKRKRASAKLLAPTEKKKDTKTTKKKLKGEGGSSRMSKQLVGGKPTVKDVSMKMESTSIGASSAPLTPHTDSNYSMAFSDSIDWTGTLDEDFRKEAIANGGDGAVWPLIAQKIEALERNNRLLAEETASLRKEQMSNRTIIKTQRAQIRSLEGSVKSLTATYNNLHQSVTVLEQNVHELCDL